MMLGIPGGLLKRCLTSSTTPCSILTRQLHGGFETKEELEAHKKSLKKFNKAALDYEYLFDVDKSKLVYKIIRMQRQLDSYTIMKGVTNIDGRDKMRVDHPDIEDIIDQDDHNRRRVAFKVAYVGWDYMAYAWSHRNNSNIKGHTNAIERVFLEALLRQQLISGLGAKTSLDRCGRTDQHVSAFSQVICVNVRTNLDEGYGVMKKRNRTAIEKSEEGDTEGVENKGSQEESTVEESASRQDYIPNYMRFSVKDRSRDHEEIPYVSLLNEALPTDIRVLAWSPVACKFSAWKACKGRTYRYYFPRGGLDIDLMNEAAQKLVGEHDFRNFAKISAENMDEKFVKEVKQIEIVAPNSRADPNLPECDICYATITSSGYLYRQVRLMMAVLLAIGNGSEDISIIDDLLDIEKMPARPAYSSVRPMPLVLHDVSYAEDEVDWRWDSDALLAAGSIMGSMWSHNVMKSEVLRGMYSNIRGRLTTEERAQIQDSVLDRVQEIDYSTIGKTFHEMDKSKSVSEFREREVSRAVRKLKRLGRYKTARSVNDGLSDKFVGWKSD